MSTERFSLFEKESEVLRSVAAAHKPGSHEELAVKTATLALLFALTEHPKEFKRFLQSYTGELTSAQRRRLAELGLDPQAGKQR